MHITNQCNLRCGYCYVDKTPEHMSAETGRAAVDAVIRSTRAGGFRGFKLKYAGGEATLRPGLLTTLDGYARQQALAAALDYEAVVLSNGVRLRRELVEYLRAHDIGVAVSLDGLGLSHDGQRRFLHGGGSVGHVLATLEQLREQGVEPFINITVTERSVSCLPETVRYVVERDLPFNLNFVRDRTGASELWATSQASLIEALHLVCDELEANLPTRSLLGMLVDRADLSRPHRRPCGVGESYMVIDQHGEVSRCHMELGSPVTSIASGDPMRALRLSPRGVRNPPVEEKVGCSDCSWRFWCAGGCPKVTYQATGRHDVQSPYCDVYRAIFPRVLRLEGLRLLRQVEAHPARVSTHVVSGMRLRSVWPG